MGTLEPKSGSAVFSRSRLGEAIVIGGSTLLADGTWVPMAVQLAAVIGAVLASWIAVRSKVYLLIT